MKTLFYNKFVVYDDIGMQIHLSYILNTSFQFKQKEMHEYFAQNFGPQFQLIIFEVEHYVIQLCQAANLLGWE